MEINQGQEEVFQLEKRNNILMKLTSSPYKYKTPHYLKTIQNHPQSSRNPLQTPRAIITLFFFVLFIFQFRLVEDCSTRPPLYNCILHLAKPIWREHHRCSPLIFLRVKVLSSQKTQSLIPTLKCAISDLTICAPHGAGNASHFQTQRSSRIIRRQQISNLEENTPDRSPRRNRKDPDDERDLATVKKALRRDEKSPSRRSTLPTRGETLFPSPRCGKRRPCRLKGKPSRHDNILKAIRTLIKPLTEGFKEMRAQQKKIQSRSMPWPKKTTRNRWTPLPRRPMEPLIFPHELADEQS
ncbi:unnamed protein product [Microthlaspi erraticum]|uniref:Uncharacterized protein n=1 Tax=Microthlaspi erraticum TaxID=1685480 RepID=A0A6D2ICS1_9BRAS|nr:unnamed protein product [Microthlaspi erraticum]